MMPSLNRQAPAWLLALALSAPGIGGCVAPRARAVASDDELRDADLLRLASVMIRDGHPDRANEVLAQIDPAAAGLDLARYHLLTGLLRLNQRRYKDSLAALDRSIVAGQADPVVHLYRVQACYGLGDHRGCLEAMERLAPRHRGLARIDALRIMSCRSLDDSAGAFSAILAAEARHPKDPEFTRHRLLTSLELGLNLAAVEAGRDFIEKAGGKPTAYLTLGEALRRSKRFDDALLFLESGRLRYPGDEKLSLALAHAYLDAGKPLAAGRIIEELAALKPKLLSEAAELYRRGGDTRRALYLNAQVGDQKVKTRQRLGILLQNKSWEEAYALAPRLARHQLLGENHVSYALAFASFKAGRYAEARAFLDTVGGELFDAAVKLRRAIEVAERADPRRP